MIEQIEAQAPKTVAFKLSGKLHDDDYRHFVPAVDRAVESEGKIRMFAQFHDFHGWDLHAAWDDVKFATKHCTTFDRIALVGEKKWEEWMAKIGKPFTTAKLRYFDASQIDDAWKWLAEPA